MKTRWREHELLLMTLVCLILLVAYLLDIHRTSVSQYSGAFVNNYVSFSLYRNLVVPQLGAAFLVYCVYLFLQLHTLPRLLGKKPKFPDTLQQKALAGNLARSSVRRLFSKKIVYLFLQLLGIVLVVGTAFNAAIYFLEEWQYSYPGFSTLLNANIQKSALNPWGYSIISLLLGLYGLYVFFREGMIRLLERPGPAKNYRILVANQITGFLCLYLLIPVFVLSFHLIHERNAAAGYLLLPVAVFLLYISNTYWLFPLLKKQKGITKNFMLRLLISTFIFTVPFVILLFPERFISVLLFCWAIQVFVVSPLTWLLYQGKKDQIMALRGAEQALEKSKTDLLFLRSQINPHFLFNILNTLYGTALKENAELTATGIQMLGEMMRFMLEQNHLDLIPMEQEINYLKNYIALQKLRTVSSPGISITEHLAAEHCTNAIAPMLLIPFVENAFKHGISLREKSWIEIRLSCSTSTIRFEVKNSMHLRDQPDPEKERKGIGLQNVIARLQLSYPEHHELSIQQSEKEYSVLLLINTGNRPENESTGHRTATEIIADSLNFNP